MLIHEVRLRNIRSYEALDLSLAEGITLLSGDIGAGKSTILHAIEFALFGIARGALEGDALLRHGQEEGSVLLTFSLAEQEYAIERTLKRTSAGVRQTTGSLLENGVRTEYSAQELKARILALLGYPEQLLTKSKGLIFRYTVYTPQEEMKHILFMQSEERLNTLRTLFGIDTYRLIKENTQLLLKELRAEEKYLVEQAATVPKLEKECAAHAQAVLSASASLEHAQAQAKQAAAAVHQARQVLAQTRQAWDYAMSIDHQRAVAQARIRELERARRNAEEDIARTDEYLAVAIESVEDHTATIENVRAEQQRLDQELLTLSQSAAAAKAEQALHQKHTEQIDGMHGCPVCGQEVTTAHKEKVHLDAAHTIARLQTTVSTTEQHIAVLHKRKVTLSTDYQRLSEQQKRYATYQRELFVRKDKERQRQLLQNRFEMLHKELQEHMVKLAQLPESDPAAKQLYEASQVAVTKLETALQEQLQVHERARDAYSRVSAEQAVAEERLNQAQSAAKRAGTLQNKRQWLDSTFLAVVSEIERHVLASIHAEFRELFGSWFSRLIEDETIQVSLGESFEPLVSQNGYDASVEQLSGGEKTAVALSYRLSLYKVVSDFVSTVRTKELLVLDEPTDGFSTEQLDRVRDVLRSLACRQILLVSHETQMESGCDHVIRIQKQLHRSSALQ